MPEWTSKKTSEPDARRQRRLRLLLKAAVHTAAWVPLARLGYLGIRHELGANPIEFITRSTGTWTLVILLLTLSVTPLRRLTGWNDLGRFRRTIGLYAFFYACLHLTTYLWLDQFFDWSSIGRDIYKRPFITAGFAAFILLLALALTSSTAAIRLLGPRLWRGLHRLVYAAAILGVIHYYWLVKRDVTQPLLFAAILALLLAYRIIAATRLSRSS
jgi:sulfoxide reductase heme-binding subunit YedZ